MKLGIRVAKRTVQRRMRGVRPPGPRGGQSWRAFLRNHTVWACDFLQTYDIWFRLVYAFFIVDVNAKRVVHVAVTRAPTQTWTAQQLRNATAFGNGPPFIIPTATTSSVRCSTTLPRALVLVSCAPRCGRRS